MSKKWKAVATYRHTHDTVVVATGEFENFEDIGAWLEDKSLPAIENVVITYNANDERLTLTQIYIDETVEVSTKETADVPLQLS